MVNSGYNVNVSCKYDEGSVRTQKTVKSIKDGNEITKTTDFITDGIQILSQKTTTVVTDKATGNQVADPATDTIIWQIDGEGTVLGFIHNNGVYYYLKNAQGDIVGIADKDSNIVASYTYDSWGKLVSIIDPSQDNLDVTDVTSGNNSSHIAHINPLRYRGYYYDQETGLYYLNARYYDPETCRFINSDNNLHGGLNLFEYCYNNPVIFSDFDGEDAILLIDKDAVGAFNVTAGHMGLAVQNSEGKWYHFYWGNNGSGIGGFKNVGTLTALDETYKDHNDINAAKVYSGTYTDSRYLKGDFTKGLEYLESIVGKKDYNLLTMNCKHTSIDALIKGDFGEYDEQYKEELALARKKNRPNMAFGHFTTFHDNEAIRKKRKLEGIHV